MLCLCVMFGKLYAQFTGNLSFVSTGSYNCRAVFVHNLDDGIYCSVPFSGTSVFAIKLSRSGDLLQTFNVEPSLIGVRVVTAPLPRGNDYTDFLTVDGFGNLYSFLPVWNSAINVAGVILLKFNSSGIQQRFDAFNTGRTLYNHTFFYQCVPIGMTVANSSFLYWSVLNVDVIGSSGHYAIYKINATNGALISSAPDVISSGITFNAVSNTIYGVTSDTRFLRYDVNLNILSPLILSSPFAIGGFGNLFGVLINNFAIDGVGSCYVASTTRNTFVRYNSTSGIVTGAGLISTGLSLYWTVDTNGYFVGTGVNGTQSGLVIFIGLASNPKTASSSSSSSSIIRSSSSTSSTGMSDPSSSALSSSVYSSSSSSGSVYAVGDPQFSGFRGQSYQVHGIDGQVYNVLSDPNIQLNARFVFLESGRCPTIEGKKPIACWTHPGSYFGEVGVQTSTGDRILVRAGTAEDGLELVDVNGLQLIPGKNYTFSTFNISCHVDGYGLTLNLGVYTLHIESSDAFLNILSVVVSDWHLLTTQLQPHGLLGQTWKSRKHNHGSANVLEGKVDDYAEEKNDLFGTAFLFGRLHVTSVQ